MSKRTRVMLALAPVVASLFAVVALAAPPGKSRLATYQNSTGQTYFALSLVPDVKVSPADAHDVVVLFDTSASQTGLYRQDALTAFKTMLGQLGPKDRVKLVAVDLNAIPLTKSFVAPNSPEMTAALAKLERRVPLGSTDMDLALRSVSDSFADAKAVNVRSAVYIGDGASRANIVTRPDFAGLIDQLVEKRIAVSSLAIGPNRDVELLAALANHTGGMLAVDTKETAPQKAGAFLARSATGTVIWPTTANLPKAMSEVFPSKVPPLRTDRDTILVGTATGLSAHDLALSGEANGQPVNLQWKVTAEKSNDDFGFLPNLVDLARNDQGRTLPTAGSAGLREAGRLMLQNAQSLAEVGRNALKLGDRQTAAHAAAAAIQRDPNNPQALALRKAVDKAAAAPRGGKANEPDLRLVNFQGAGDPGAGDLLNQFAQEEGAFLGEVVDQKKADQDRVKTEIQNELKQANQKMIDNPEDAMRQLKLQLESLKRVPDLDPEVRAQMTHQIETAVRQAGRRAMEQQEVRRLAEQNKAAAKEALRLVEDTTRKREKIKQLMDEFNSLMIEGRYRQADEEVAAQVRTLEPDSATPMTATWMARFTRQIKGMELFRDVRHRNFADALYEAERALIPFIDEPPIVYPNAEVWEELTLRRAKYKSVDLAGDNAAEKKIYAALSDDTTMEFIETELSAVIDYLKDFHSIPIVLDTKALEAAGIGTDTPITQNLRGITLKSGLKLLLTSLELTYIIKDEVLKITTKEAAESADNMVTRVYPVGDLVMPIQGGSINPFQLGGGQGGQGGFGGGGGGQGGGGFGGGGQGGGGFGGGGQGGGGGGFFAIPDQLDRRR